MSTLLHVVGGPSKPEVDVTAYFAATRTLFALQRTGLSITGAGALATSLLARTWPSWVIGVLSAGYVLLGVSLVWVAIRKQNELRRRYRGHEGELLFPYAFVAAACVIAQCLMVALLALYVISIGRASKWVP